MFIIILVSLILYLKILYFIIFECSICGNTTKIIEIVTIKKKWGTY